MKALAIALLLSCSARAAENRYTVKEGGFSIDVPKGWAAQRDAAEDERQKTYGVMLVGPRGEGGVAAKIQIDYYAPGNTLSGDAGTFLTRVRDAGLVKPLGEVTGPLKAAKLAGLAGQRFERRTTQTVPPNSMRGQAVKVVQDYIVAASTAGFYVASFAGPADLYERQRGAFSAVLRSLRLSR